MADQRRTVIAKKNFLNAYAKSNGVISRACEESGVDRKSVYDWKKHDDDFLIAMEMVIDTQIDYVESKLLDRIEEGDADQLIQFYLKAKAKQQGYGKDSVDVTSGGKPIENITVIKMVEIKKEENE